VARSNARIAVAMATFNGARFLDTQLRSIFDQTRLPDQIVISDDHSADDTLAIARSYRAEAKKRGIEFSVLTHRGEPGVATNFSYAVSQCAADYVALADQDDWWEPGKLAALEAHFEARPGLLMVHSDAELVDEAGEQLGMGVLESLRITRGEQHDLASGHGIRALVRRNLVTGSTSMIRQGLVSGAGEIPAGWLHDEWWALVAASQDGLLLDPRRHQHYRQHDSNQVGASQSGLKRLMERFSEPQQEFRARHEIRHQGLWEYVTGPNWSGTSEAKKLLIGRLQHYRWQATLPGSRIARIPRIIQALIRGDYAKCRRGVFDALRDALQPA
jgi:glycosyltransferase involved in cell wall biosynthesis